LVYTDPSGEVFLVDDAILGLIGGSINVLTNLGSIHNIGQGAAFFGVGFVSGALSEYITPVGSAALMGAGNAALLSYNNTGSVDIGAVLQGAATSAIIGGVTMGLGQALTPVANKALSGIASPILRQAATQGAIGSFIGGAGGGVGAAINGGNIWQGIGQGALWGGGIGFATGAYTGYGYAKARSLNPWTGKDLHPITPMPTRNTNNIKIEPKNLSEQISLKAAKSGEGGPIMIGEIKDPNFQNNWQKMSYYHKLPDNMGYVEIHY